MSDISINKKITNKDLKLSIRDCIIGDRAFYNKLFLVVVPIIIQNTLTNVVGLLDNIMVGRIGTLQMSAVAIVSQLMFVFYVCVWGGIAGAGIYGAQFFGKGDLEGVRNTFRIKLIIAFATTFLALVIFLYYGDNLFSLYISKDTLVEDKNELIKYGIKYLRIMLIGLIPFSVTQCIAGTIRESGKTSLPMTASMLAMVVNFVLNLLLIFGILGFPKLGVAGAAIATVISRFVELLIVVIGIFIDSKSYYFMFGIFGNFKIPSALFYNILIKAAPLLINECLWAVGEATILQLYSTRGINAVAAMNINNTVAQIFNEIFLSLGNAAAIIIGQTLGSNKLREAVRDAWRIIFFSIFGCIVMGLLLLCFTPFIPNVYNTTIDIKLLAKKLLVVSAIVMPLRGMTNAAYFTIRSGGKTWITLLFDSCYSWIILIPFGYYIAHFTTVKIIPFYAIIAGMEIIKCFIAIILLKSNSWVKNIVN